MARAQFVLHSDFTIIPAINLCFHSVFNSMSTPKSNPTVRSSDRTLSPGYLDLKSLTRFSLGCNREFLGVRLSHSMSMRFCWSLCDRGSWCYEPLAEHSILYA